MLLSRFQSAHKSKSSSIATGWERRLYSVATPQGKSRPHLKLQISILTDSYCRFIVNRLLVPYMLEAIRMVERGDASAVDIDTAMKLGSGMPMGPVELADFIGLDTLSNIARGWRNDRVKTGEMEDKAVEEVEMLERLVSEGKLGRKSGEGFFKCESFSLSLSLRMLD